MKYTPDYQIEISGGGKVPLLFNTWSFRTFCKQRGIEFGHLLKLIGETFPFDDFPALLLSAAESFCRYNEQEFNYTDLNSNDWIDEMGGLLSPKLREVYGIFVSKLTRVPVNNISVTAEKLAEEEKKS